MQKRGNGNGWGIGRRTVVALVTLITTATCGAADAATWEYRADDLRIFRPGAAYFSDAFEDGNPQLAPGGFESPSGANGSYFIDGTPTESDGRLVLNSIGATGPGDFSPVGLELALLDTPTTDRGVGLNIDTSFAIFSRWDLILPPAGSFSGFEMGLTDAELRHDPNGPSRGNDRVNLGVMRFLDGSLGIAFSAQDRLDPLNFLALAVHPLTSADFVGQIDLALVKAAEGDSPITAFWRFVDGAALPTDVTDVSGFHPLLGSRDIYNGEIFTRVQLNGFGDRLAVPVPPSLLLLTLAVAIGLVGRRHLAR